MLMWAFEEALSNDKAQMKRFIWALFYLWST